MVDSLNLTLGKFGPSKLAQLEHVGFDFNRLRRSLPPLQTLVAFEAAARLRSFTLASAELSLSQPAISQQIRLLEERLGVALFQRANNQITVTPQGAVLAQVVSEMLAKLADTVETVKSEGARSTLSVSLLPSFASTWFASRIGRFERENPNIDLVVLSTVACVEFDHEDVDVAIRRGRGGWSSGLYEEKLLDETFIAVASPDLIKSIGPIETIADLANIPFVHDTDFNEWRALIQLNGGDPASLSRVYTSETPAPRYQPFSADTVSAWSETCSSAISASQGDDWRSCPRPIRVSLKLSFPVPHDAPAAADQGVPCLAGPARIFFRACKCSGERTLQRGVAEVNSGGETFAVRLARVLPSGRGKSGQSLDLEGMVMANEKQDGGNHGAAGGIGKAIVRRFIEDGYRVGRRRRRCGRA